MERARELQGLEDICESCHPNGLNCLQHSRFTTQDSLFAGSGLCITSCSISAELGVSWDIMFDQRTVVKWIVNNLPLLFIFLREAHT